MRGLIAILALGFLKGIWMRFFLGRPERRNQVSPEAASKTRLTADGSAQPYQYTWPRRTKSSGQSPQHDE